MIARVGYSADEHAAMRRIASGQRAPITPLPAPVNHKLMPAAGPRRERMLAALRDVDDTDDMDELDAERPRTRGDCLAGGINSARPCPWVGCRHHNFLDVSEETGFITLTQTDVELCADTCSLDVADRGDHTLEEVGDALNVTRERIRQREAKASETLRLALRRAGIRPGDQTFTHPALNEPL